MEGKTETPLRKLILDPFLADFKGGNSTRQKIRSSMKVSESIPFYRSGLDAVIKLIRNAKRCKTFQ